MKLYRVTLRGGGEYKISYAVEEDSDKAYRKVREFLDDKGLCFQDERELQCVELIADTKQYSGLGTMLFI